MKCTWRGGRVIEGTRAHEIPKPRFADKSEEDKVSYSGVRMCEKNICKLFFHISGFSKFIGVSCLKIISFCDVTP